MDKTINAELLINDIQFDIEVEGSDFELDASMDVGTGEGTTKHDKLTNRDLPDQHPIESITGLLAMLQNFIRLDSEVILDCGHCPPSEE